MKTKELIEILTALVENRPEAAEYDVVLNGQEYDACGVSVDESFYEGQDFVVNIY